MGPEATPPASAQSVASGFVPRLPFRSVFDSVFSASRFMPPVSRFPSLLLPLSRSDILPVLGLGPVSLFSFVYLSWTVNWFVTRFPPALLFCDQILEPLRRLGLRRSPHTYTDIRK